MENFCLFFKKIWLRGLRTGLFGVFGYTKVWDAGTNILHWHITRQHVQITENIISTLYSMALIMLLSFSIPPPAPLYLLLLFLHYHLQRPIYEFFPAIVIVLIYYVYSPFVHCIKSYISLVSIIDFINPNVNS